MDALLTSDFQNEGIKYLTFSNQDGKRWSIPLQNMRVALELYEPSGIKGKLLKKLLPIAARIGIAKKILHGSYTSIQMSKELRRILVKCFGEEWEYSVFWGTPCVDQKITIQIYTKQKILGYCKIGSSERVKALFQHEKTVLDLLQERGMAHVSRCLALEQVSDRCWAFVQRTEKVPGAKTEHSYGEKQSCFLENLWQATKKSVLFEETDYYRSLMFLEQHLDMIDDTYREAVEKALMRVKETYSGKKVEWGVSHRDFTPWNTCIVDNELFAFDFEYALMHAPKGMDEWHFFVQTKYFEEKCDVEQIAKEYQKLKKNGNTDILFNCYLLDIICLYLMRGEREDLYTANQRAKLLSKIIINK